MFYIYKQQPEIDLSEAYYVIHSMYHYDLRPFWSYSTSLFTIFSMFKANKQKCQDNSNKNRR